MIEENMSLISLKTWPEYYQQVIEGFKTFELRKNDRDFKRGSVLLLREWCPSKEDYTGRICSCLVLSVLHGGKFGLDEDYCIMSIQLIKP